MFFTLCLMSAEGSCSMLICWCGQFLTVLWNGNSWFGYFVALLYIYLSMLWQFVTTTFLMMLEITCDYNLLNQESWQRHKSSQFVWWFRDGIACDYNCLCPCGEFWHSRDNNTLLQCSGLERERIMFITHLKPLQPKTAITDVWFTSLCIYTCILKVSSTSEHQSPIKTGICAAPPWAGKSRLVDVGGMCCWRSCLVPKHNLWRHHSHHKSIMKKHIVSQIKKHCCNMQYQIVLKEQTIFIQSNCKTLLASRIVRKHFQLHVCYLLNISACHSNQGWKSLGFLWCEETLQQTTVRDQILHVFECQNTLKVLLTEELLFQKIYKMFVNVSIELVQGVFYTKLAVSDILQWCALPWIRFCTVPGPPSILCSMWQKALVYDFFHMAMDWIMPLHQVIQLFYGHLYWMHMQLK